MLLISIRGMLAFLIASFSGEELPLKNCSNGVSVLPVTVSYFIAMYVSMKLQCYKILFAVYCIIINLASNIMEFDLPFKHAITNIAMP